MHRLIVTDLDGTLLNDEHVVTSDTISTFQELHELGHVFAIASGRHYIDAKGVRDIIGVPAYIVSSNGARVHSPNDELIYEENIDPKIAREIISLALPEDVVRNVFTSTEWLIDREEPVLLEIYRDSGFTYRVTNLHEYSGQGAAKLLFVGEPVLLAGVEKALTERFGTFVTATYSLPDSLEIMATGISKGIALQSVMDRTGIAPQDVLAFGDNLNDVEMLRVSGNPHVMANAHPRLFELFPSAARIGKNSEGAVAGTLRRLLLLPSDRAIERLC